MASLSYDEKLKKGMSFKDAGNAFFTKGQIKPALLQYHSACTYLQGLERNYLGLTADKTHKTATNDPESAVVSEDKKQLSMVKGNMAACYIKIEKYSRAVECCNEAIKADDSNMKARFRKAQAYRLSDEIQKAHAALAEYIDKHPAQQDSFNTEKALLAELEKKRQAKADAAMKGFLNKKDTGKKTNGK